MPKHNFPGSTGLRLQGTDGIRRETRPAKEFPGLTPQEVFLQRGFITEEFMELYAYAHARQLVAEKNRRPAIVVGWDPRDPLGLYNNAVIRGVRKAGADVLCIGISPTPLVPTYMLYKNAQGGFMITASHNPKDQNGIKTFLAFRGMKLLPCNDIELTRNVLALDYQSIAQRPLSGNLTNCRNEALEVFSRFSIHPENSWATPGAFDNTLLVVDPANGALSGIAVDIFRQAGFGQVIEVNGNLDGNVNLHSGVADLEGHKIISPAMIDAASGSFRHHQAILKMFELGRKFRQKILSGKLHVSGAVFDADGDRFYRLDYQPFRDEILVLSGDETAFMQAQYLIQRDPGRYHGTAYINTVESDLNAGIAAENLGLKLHLAAVGDKWILLRIAALIAASRLKPSGKKISALKRELSAMLRAGILDAHQFREFEKKTGGQNLKHDQAHIPFAVGSEETGHNITLGWMDTEAGGRIPVFFGNGLKSALNTFSATARLTRNKSALAGFRYLERPFKPGFKRTCYVYYVIKELFHKGSAIWKQVKRNLFDEGKKMGYLCGVSTFKEDPDMLYVTLKPRAGSKKQCAGIFVRNSGTENKIGVNLRCDRKDARKLQSLAERVTHTLLTAMKDKQNHLYKMELDVLLQLKARPLREREINIHTETRSRVLHEMKKQDLIRLSAKGFQLSPKGKWYISNIDKS